MFHCQRLFGLLHVHVVCIWGSPNLDVFHSNEIFDLLSHHSYNSNIGEFVMILLKNYLYLYS